jgi:hypothetical protein
MPALRRRFGLSLKGTTLKQLMEIASNRFLEPPPPR